MCKKTIAKKLFQNGPIFNDISLIHLNNNRSLITLIIDILQEKYILDLFISS